MRFAADEEGYLSILAHQDNEQRARGYHLFHVSGRGLAEYLEMLIKAFENAPADVKTHPACKGVEVQIGLLRRLVEKLRPLDAQAARALLDHYAAAMNKFRP